MFLFPSFPQIFQIIWNTFVYLIIVITIMNIN